MSSYHRNKKFSLHLLDWFILEDTGSLHRAVILTYENQYCMLDVRSVINSHHLTKQICRETHTQVLFMDIGNETFFIQVISLYHQRILLYFSKPKAAAYLIASSCMSCSSKIRPVLYMMHYPSPHTREK